MEDKEKQKSTKEEKTVKVAKNAAELQKIRLEKLMSNPEKPAHIPDKSKPYKPRDPLEFVRNVWGSSAGAGSGDFHVYRGVRRREYARQKFNKEKNEKEEADDAYHKKVEENAKAAEERTAKKRAKRQKKKQHQKNKKPKKEEEKVEDSESEEEEENDTEQNVNKDTETRDTENTETRDSEITDTDKNEKNTDIDGKTNDSGVENGDSGSDCIQNEGHPENGSECEKDSENSRENIRSRNHEERDR